MSWKLTAEYAQKFAKKDAIRIADALNKAGIDCELEEEHQEEVQRHPLAWFILTAKKAEKTGEFGVS